MVLPLRPALSEHKVVFVTISVPPKRLPVSTLFRWRNGIAWITLDLKNDLSRTT
jgi:hypothetical protein